MSSSDDKDVVTAGSHEPNAVFPLWTEVQYLLIQCLRQIYRTQLLGKMRRECSQSLPHVGTELTHGAGPNRKQNPVAWHHYKFCMKDDQLADKCYSLRMEAASPSSPTPNSLCSWNWPDHHRGRWVGSFPGLLWGVWTGRASHQNTSKDSSVPRAQAGHMRRLQTGPCLRHSWRELTAECLEGRGSQSLNGKEWFLWSKSTAVPSSHNIWL